MANHQDNLVCANCSGTFFTTIRAEQFLAGGYGTAEFRSVSNSPKTVLQCIGCGTPVSPKPAYYGKSTTAGVEEAAFRKSIEAGQKYRKDNSIKNVANIAVSPTELQQVRNLVEDIKKAVEASGKPKAPKAKQEVKQPVGV